MRTKILIRVACVIAGIVVGFFFWSTLLLVGFLVIFFILDFLERKSVEKIVKQNESWRKLFLDFLSSATQTETIILENIELVLTHETLSREGEQRLEEIQKYCLGINEVLEKAKKSTEEKD